MTLAAAQLAKKAEYTNVPILQLVSFQLFGETFALPILDVREVIPVPDITPVPHAPSFVEGVINLRGQIIPIVDMRRRFGMQSGEITNESRIIVAELGNGISLGLTVDEVRDVERIPADGILPPPAIIATTMGAEYIKGISNHDDKMIVHIDLRRVFSLQELDVLEHVA